MASECVLERDGVRLAGIDFGGKGTPERARMVAAGGALVSLIGVFLLIYFLAS